MLDKHLQFLLKGPLIFISKRIGNFTNPNSISLIGFLFGLMMCVSIVLGLFKLSILLLIFNRLFDGIDGSLARLTHPTPLGGYIDIVFDFLIYSGFVLSFGIMDQSNLLICSILLFVYIGTGTTFLARAAIENNSYNNQKNKFKDHKHIHKSFYFTYGLIEGGETTLFMFICLIFPNSFNLLGLIFFILCSITIVSRIYVCYKELN